MTRVKGFQALGRHVARAQDAWLRGHPGAAAAVRERLLAFDDERPVVPRASRWQRWALLLTAAAVVVLGILLWPSAGKPLAFEVGPKEGETASPSAAPTPGAVGEWIAAPQQAALPLRFSDGSVIVLDADARARVAEVTAHGARVVVERGAAQVRVVHGPETHWDIKAGPFDVRVVGTAFDVGWDPARISSPSRSSRARWPSGDVRSPVSASWPQGRASGPSVGRGNSLRPPRPRRSD